MRLWTIHPSYLDTKGLLAVWREALLAQHVLAGETKGYVNHPQLQRFKEYPQPLLAIAVFLTEICAEAQKRGYNFDKTKIRTSIPNEFPLIAVNDGQVQYEFEWLKSKLQTRDPRRYEALLHDNIGQIRLNGLFTLRKGPVEPWEKME